MGDSDLPFCSRASHGFLPHTSASLVRNGAPPPARSRLASTSATAKPLCASVPAKPGERLKTDCGSPRLHFREWGLPVCLWRSDLARPSVSHISTPRPQWRSVTATAPVTIAQRICQNRRIFFPAKAERTIKHKTVPSHTRLYSAIPDPNTCRPIISWT